MIDDEAPMNVFRLTGTVRRVVFAAAVLALAMLAATPVARGDDERDGANERPPLVLTDEGSFFVGGTNLTKRS
jgi:hypothetical protein